LKSYKIFENEIVFNSTYKGTGRILQIFSHGKIHFDLDKNETAILEEQIKNLEIN